MESVAKYFGPQSPSGSILSAIMVHGLAYGLIMLFLGLGYLKGVAPQAEVELGYEVLDAPPALTKIVQRVARAVEPPTPIDPKIKPDNGPKELQDEKSDVAGTQTAAKAQVVPGSESDGTANATPYYKIKPKYPRAALVSGAEGWVLLKIDIKESGEVENVRVVSGEKRNLFQDEARRAVEQWKYRPFVDGQGKPFKKLDHQVRVDFKLNDVQEGT